MQAQQNLKTNKCLTLADSFRPCYNNTVKTIYKHIFDISIYVVTCALVKMEVHKHQSQYVSCPQNHPKAHIFAQQNRAEDAWRALQLHEGAWRSNAAASAVQKMFAGQAGVRSDANAHSLTENDCDWKRGGQIVCFVLLPRSIFKRKCWGLQLQRERGNFVTNTFQLTGMAAPRFSWTPGQYAQICVHSYASKAHCCTHKELHCRDWLLHSGLLPCGQPLQPREPLTGAVVGEPVFMLRQNVSVGLLNRRFNFNSEFPCLNYLQGLDWDPNVFALL